MYMNLYEIILNTLYINFIYIYIFIINYTIKYTIKLRSR